MNFRTGVSRLTASVSQGRVRDLALEASRFFSLQFAIMALNLVVGLLILRFLPKSEYALYTIGFAILSIFTDVSAAGVSPAVQSLAGSRWTDRVALGSLVRTAISFRKTVALALGLPLFAYGLWQCHLVGAEWFSSIALLVVFGLGGLTQLEAQIFKTPLRFHRRIGVLQRAELWGGGAKLAGVAVFGIFAPNATVFAAVSAGAFAVDWALTRRAAKEVMDFQAPTEPALRTRIVELFKPTFPSAAYWSFQGQITILLCSLFGTIENVAEMGALGKLAMAFTFLTALISSYIHPAISKAVGPTRILRLSTLVLGIFLVATAALLGIAYFFPGLLLLVLGDRYENLSNVLTLAVGVSMLSLLEGQILSLCQVRGWVRYVGWYGAVAIVTQVVLLLTMPLDGLYDILVFNGVVVAATLLYVAGVFAYEFHAFRRGVTKGEARP